LKLADWARKNGFDYKTAYRPFFRSGKFPRPVEQLPTGTILVHDLPVTTNNAVLYARVSSGDQAADLDRQMQRPRDYAAAQGAHAVQEVQEIGSGLNGHRKRLKALENPPASTIVVEHRDRLARFGSEYIESALASSNNRKVVIVDDTEMKDDLVQDMMIDVVVLTSFCARLYGRRAARNKAKRALQATEK